MKVHFASDFDMLMSSIIGIVTLVFLIWIVFGPSIQDWFRSFRKKKL